MKERMIPVCCPKCSHSFEIRRDSLEIAGFNEQAMQRMRNETYFAHQCSKCHTIFDLCYPFMYRNPKKRFSILLSDASPAGLDRQEQAVLTSSPAQFYTAFKALEDGMDLKVVISIKSRMEKKLGQPVQLESFDPDRGILWFIVNSGLTGYRLAESELKCMKVAKKSRIKSM